MTPGDVDLETLNVLEAGTPVMRLIFRTPTQLEGWSPENYRVITDPAVIARQRVAVLASWEQGHGWEYDEPSGRTILIECSAT